LPPENPKTPAPPFARSSSCRAVHACDTARGGDAFAHAVALAPEGAGTLVYVAVRSGEFAVVLEPEEPLRSARRALYAEWPRYRRAGGPSPPEKPITIDWPDAVRVDNCLVGGGRLAWPEVG